MFSGPLHGLDLVPPFHQPSSEDVVENAHASNRDHGIHL